jgi:hypothetical protein
MKRTVWKFTGFRMWSSVVNFVMGKSNNYYIFWDCVYSLRYPAWNAHAPYWHQWPIELYIVFPHYLIKDTIFENPLLNIKWLFWFSLKFLSETFLILRGAEIYFIINVQWSFYRWIVHFEIYVVNSPTNALFINLVEISYNDVVLPSVLTL